MGRILHHRGGWRVVAALLILLANLPAQADPPRHAEWALTFQEDFDGQALNWDVWQSDHGIRGAEKLEGRWPENNILKDGILFQVTRRENPPRGGKDWSTAHIWTRSFAQQYGYFEARMRYGRFLNNAFWLFRPQGARFPDPPHFEIDINEGHTPREIAMTLHYYMSDSDPRNRDHYGSGKTWDAADDLDADFHLYGAEWNEKEIVWYFDGRPIRRIQNLLCHAPADVRLSTVIMPRQLEKEGGNLDAMDGVSMAVDWVRAHRKTKDLYAPELPEMETFAPPKIAERPPQVAQGKTRTLLFAEDFESPASGGLPARWEAGDQTPRVVPDQAVGRRTPLAPDNKVLLLSPGDYVFRTFDRPAAGRLEAEFDYWTPPLEGLLFVTLGDFDKHDPALRKTSYYTGDIGPYIHWNRRFVWYYTEKDKWTPFALSRRETWTRVRILMDIPAGVFECYTGANMAEFAGGGVFRHRQKAAKGVGLRHRGLAGTVCVDNLVVRVVEN